MNPPGRTVALDDVIEQNEDHMKAQTKTKSTRNRIVEVILTSFILVLIARAVPNLKPFPEANYESEAHWGDIARAQFVTPHQTASGVRRLTTPPTQEQESLRTLLIQPKKFELWFPLGIKV